MERGINSLLVLVEEVFGAVDTQAHEDADEIKARGGEANGRPELAVVGVGVSEYLFRPQYIVGAECEA